MTAEKKPVEKIIEQYFQHIKNRLDLENPQSSVDW